MIFKTQKGINCLRYFTVSENKVGFAVNGLVLPYHFLGINMVGRSIKIYCCIRAIDLDGTYHKKHEWIGYDFSKLNKLWYSRD